MGLIDWQTDKESSLTPSHSPPRGRGEPEAFLAIGSIHEPAPLVLSAGGEFTLELVERLAAGGADRLQFGQQLVGIAGAGVGGVAGS